MLNHTQSKLHHTAPIVYVGIDAGSISNFVYVPRTREIVGAREIQLDKSQLVQISTHRLTKSFNMYPTSTKPLSTKTRFTLDPSGSDCSENGAEVHFVHQQLDEILMLTCLAR